MYIVFRTAGVSRYIIGCEEFTRSAWSECFCFDKNSS